MRLSFGFAALLAAAVSVTLDLGAQETILTLSPGSEPKAIALAHDRPRPAGESCLRARPAPECTLFFLTNAGVYVRAGETSPWQAIVDWGAMMNLNQRTAIGGSAFVTLDEDDEFTIGLVARYRHWFQRGRSLDLAVGTPLTSGGRPRLKSGSLLALVKYNPVHWFGVALRPEYIRREIIDCDARGCTEHTASSGRLYAGAEFGSVPGLTLSLAGVAALGVLAILFSGFTWTY